MNKKILVAYSSRTGWTVGAAEEIGKNLANRGILVDVLAMKDVKSLSPYSAVIAGSGIQGKLWLPEAMKFIRENQEELRKKTFCRIFGLHDTGNATWRKLSFPRLDLV